MLTTILLHHAHDLFESAIREWLFKCGPAAIMSLRGALENCLLAMFFTLFNINSFRRKLYSKMEL